MDPYKVLGISSRQVKHQTDLDKVRHRAHKMWKRYAKERRKFDAKKVLDAFELIKTSFKNTIGSGQYQLIGRSRKERELDKHFNHQTKEIKKNKDLKRALRKARKGEARFHLPGDKERIPRKYHRSRRRRRREEAKRRAAKATNIPALEGLTRLSNLIPQKSKFTKVIKLLLRWIKEHGNMDSRQHVFQVLHSMATHEFITEDPDARQDVISVYEYVLGYFQEWFDQSPEHKMLGESWRVATVLACRCFTDDAFMLSSTISKLNEALKMLESHQDAFAERDQRLKLKAERQLERELKIEKRQEAKRAKVENGSKEELDAKEENVKAEGLNDSVVAGMALPVATPAELASPGSPDKDDDEEEDKESDGEVEDLEGSDSDGELKDDDGIGGSKEELIELDSDDDEGGVKEEPSGSSSEGEGESDDDVEEVEDSIFPVPDIADSLDSIRAHFVNRCLYTLFNHRGPLWARPKIDAFFQDVFYRRSAFAEHQQTQVEAWQSRIKTMQKLAEHNIGEANSNPLESHRPIVDSREERTVFDADSNAWAAKQTFDSREVYGGRKVIR